VIRPDAEGEADRRGPGSVPRDPRSLHGARLPAVMKSVQIRAELADQPVLPPVTEPQPGEVTLLSVLEGAVLGARVAGRWAWVRSGSLPAWAAFGVVHAGPRPRSGEKQLSWSRRDSVEHEREHDGCAEPTDWLRRRGAGEGVHALQCERG